MRKKNFFLIFLGLFIFLGLNKDLKAIDDEGMIPIKWYQTNGSITKINVHRNIDRSVCSLKEGLPVDYNFCQPGAADYNFKWDVFTYKGERKWDKKECNNFNQYCVNEGSIDDKNSTADCVGRNGLPTCNTGDEFKGTGTVRMGDWGCINSTTFGRCDKDGNFVCTQECPDQQNCEISIDNKGNDGERIFYQCIDNNCKDQGLLNTQKKCGGNLKGENYASVVSCLDGKIETIKCPGDEVCFYWRNGQAECHLPYGDDVCISLRPPNDSKSIGPYLNSYVGCLENRIISCTQPPYVDLGDDCSLLGLTCYKYPDKNEAGCETEDGIREYEASIDTIKTTTSNLFWCETGVSIKTAIGCIPIKLTGENGMVSYLLPYIFGIAGGIAFLMMIYGFIMISTSSGDEKKMAEARKIVTSAITGLLFSLFALFLYRLIAVDILQIPGIN